MKGIECPNHKVELTLTDDPGIGICPISYCRFEYKANEEGDKGKVRITAGGRIEHVKTYTIKPIDGGEV